MTKPSSTFPASQVSSSDGATTTEPEERSTPHASSAIRFLESVGISDPEVENYSSKDFYSVLLCNHLKTHTVQRGHVTSFTTVKPPITNSFGGLHGGVVAAIAERVAIATARTAAELVVDGSVIRSGRNITVIATEFKMEKTGRLVYSCRATFYSSPGQLMKFALL
ncbi:Signal recognition particle receptor protein isoform 1 [Hibiscus syriacus]|uniref:Signal recognition particle receptor protein isoform 1 n=1 Tax=Hibiscus syriacus TaxID=106335 RepID=A0A6A3A2X4_HIBSY|nr:Signal recognition particle receptor protein isoform 1 [Hibiscus syriacus]